MNVNNLNLKICLFVALVFMVFSAQTDAVMVPQVQTNSATDIQSNSAVLQGYISDLGDNYSSMVWFQYGTSSSYGYETIHTSKNSTGQFSQLTYGLSPNTTYHFRAVVQNYYTTSYGQDMTFYTSNNSGGVNSQIIVNAGQDQNVNSGQSVVLQGYAYDNYGNSSLSYSWSCNGGTLSSYSIAQPTFTAPYNQSQTSYICTLTVYSNNYNYYNSNSSSDSVTIYVNSGGGGSYYGNFYAETGSATNIFNNQVTLNGLFSGGSYPVNIYFQWGTGTGYGYSSNIQQFNYSGFVSQNIANLLANTTYHYRLVAQDKNGNTVYGQDKTFYTLTTGGGDYHYPAPYYPNYNNASYTAGVVQTISQLMVFLQQLLVNLQYQ